MESKTSFGHPNTYEYVANAINKQLIRDYSTHRFYPRSGFVELFDFEIGLAHLVGLGKKQRLLVLNSGMSAVVAALEITNPTREDSILHGISIEEYGKTGVYINEDLVNERGVISHEVDAGSLAAIDQKLQELKGKSVKAIFFETVGNGPGMPVLDIESFLALESLHQLQPKVIILDNTLPTNSVVPLSEHMAAHPELPIIGLESLTKFYFNNEDMGGFVFTQDKLLEEKLYNKRTRIGLIPAQSLIEKFAGITEKNKAAFDRENRLTMENTLRLARECAKADGCGDRYVIRHPNLSGHPNYEYVSAHYPQGITPLFFIEPLGLCGKFAGREIFHKLGMKGAFDEIEITESFGFGDVTVSENKGVIRICGGLKDITRHAASLKKALATV